MITVYYVVYNIGKRKKYHKNSRVKMEGMNSSSALRFLWCRNGRKSLRGEQWEFKDQTLNLMSTTNMPQTESYDYNKGDKNGIIKKGSIHPVEGRKREKNGTKNRWDK